MSADQISGISLVLVRNLLDEQFEKIRVCLRVTGIDVTAIKGHPDLCARYGPRAEGYGQMSGQMDGQVKI